MAIEGRMLRVAIAATSLICTAAAQPPPTSSAPQAPGWVRPHRHFSFSGIIFDLDYGYWDYAIWEERLRDCSTETMQCLASPTFSVVVPRRCADLSAGRWTVGDISTEVLLRHRDSSPPLHGGGSQTRLYLVTAGRPNVLYVYDLYDGINAFWWDRPHSIDFVTMAREGRLEDWLFNQANRPAWQGRAFFRMTNDAVGACQE